MRWKNAKVQDKAAIDEDGNTGKLKELSKVELDDLE